MLNGEIARMQIADRVRDAEFDRRARGARRPKTAARAATRRTMRAVLVTALHPGRH
jgi:hypothetical protein